MMTMKCFRCITLFTVHFNKGILMKLATVHEIDVIYYL